MKFPSVRESNIPGDIVSKKMLFGEFNRYALYAVQTRFGTVQWFVEDANKNCEIIRQEDSPVKAIEGLTRTYKDLFLWFVHEKNKILKEETGLNLLYKKDFERYEEYTEEMCKRFFLDNIFSTDTEICPDCFTVEGECLKCKYRTAHSGLSCYNKESHYNKILYKLKNSSRYKINIYDSIYDVLSEHGLLDEVSTRLKQIEEESNISYLKDTE